jgi:sec-independent protein translocase protein TatB
MFEFDAGKLILIGIVALIVIGPKELPRVMLQLGRAAAKMRRMAAEFHAQFMDAMREAEVEDIKADVAKLAQSAKTNIDFDPLAQIKAELTNVMESADKPAAHGADSNPMIAAPDGTESASSIALPLLPKAPDQKAPEIETGASAANPEPPAAIAPEMRPLADALAADTGQETPLHAETHIAATHDKV